MSDNTTTVHGEPSEDMCCLVTMEDITTEDGNYGTCILYFSVTTATTIPLSTVGFKRFKQNRCSLSLFRFLFCLCITVEFQGYPSLQWRPALFEQAAVEQLMTDQFHQFVERVKTTDCQAELRRLLATGPPVYVSDQNGFPLPEGDTHVVNLWYASDNQERSAKLAGAVDGEEREALWNELRAFLIVEGKEEGDDDDGGKEKS
jgi:hypothetical protein